MKILVTGGSGFIGTHLCRKLSKEGHELRVLDIAHPKAPVGGVNYVQGDVRDPRAVQEAVKDIDAVFHFAAMVSVPLCQENPTESYRTNVQSTAILIDSILGDFRRTGRKLSDFRLVFSSSAAVYGNIGTLDDPLQEETIAPEPSSNYAAQKIASEEMIRVFHREAGLPAINLRFFNVYGPGQDPKSPYSGVISILSERIFKGELVRIFGTGKQTRDFIDVRDIVAGCAAALQAPASACDGQAMNLATGAAISVEELARMMMELTGKIVPIEKLPARDGDILHSLASIDRARELLAWKPATPLRQGLAELLRER